MTIDPTTNLGRIRLRIGDFGDVPILPDDVITQTLTDNNNSLVQTAQTCAGYILGILSSKTHRKLGQLETWGSDQFENYMNFLQKVVLNPNLAGVCPIPYTGTNVDGLDINPLLQSKQDWEAGYAPGAIVLPWATYTYPYPAPLIISTPT
jgi:hypothetical protein